MRSGRLEAFSDGVLAIIITIMVLELEIPKEADLASLKEVLPTFLAYVFSFIYVGIYWNNHHHLFHATEQVSGKVLWANLHLLFWLSLFPFVTGWMGQNFLQEKPVILYGIVLFMAAIAYKLLVYAIVKNEGEKSLLRKAFGDDKKGNLSIIIYLLGILVSFYFPNSWNNTLYPCCTDVVHPGS